MNLSILVMNKDNVQRGTFVLMMLANFNQFVVEPKDVLAILCVLEENVGEFVKRLIVHLAT